MARRRGTKFPDLVLKVSFDEPKGSEGYCHVNGWIDRRDDHYFSSLGPEGLYRGVKFRSQSDWRHLVERESHQVMYGFDLQWDDTDNHLQSLRRGVQALGRIEAALTRVREKYGPPASFGSWVQRVAGAIGVGAVRIYSPGSQDRDEVSPDQAASTIDHVIRDWASVARKRAGVEVA